jgi:phospholipid/cholesterol/gamma-HCH transport system substrate-binding protein
MSRNSRYRSAEIKAGLWIFISMLILTAFVVGITGAKFWKEMDHYRVRLDYIGGLEVGSLVRMGGLVVGKISGIEILAGDRGGLELTLEVREGLPVKENTVAYLAFLSITSEQHLELESGKGPAPLLAPGDTIRTRESVDISDVQEKMIMIGDTLQALLGNVDKIFSPINIARIDSIIAQVNCTLLETSPKVGTILVNVNHATASLDSLLREVAQFMSGADTSITSVLSNTRQMMDEAKGAMADIDTTVNNVDLMVTGNSAKMTEVLNNLYQISVNLKDLSSTIRDNPFLLIRAIPKKERKLEK